MTHLNLYTINIQTFRSTLNDTIPPQGISPDRCLDGCIDTLSFSLKAKFNYAGLGGASAVYMMGDEPMVGMPPHSLSLEQALRK